MENDIKTVKHSVGSIILLILTILFCVSNVLSYWLLYEVRLLYIILFTVLNACLVIGAFIFFFTGLKSWFKTVFICAIITLVVTWGYYALFAFGLLDIFNSKEALQDAIASTGGWGMLVYVLLQFLQVTFIPLPAMLTTVVGTIMFGPLVATLLSLVGIMAGSIFAFWLGDKFGEKIVIWIAGKEQTEKYSKLIYEKGKYLFFLMMLFPLFPDDILCLVAGMTAMPFRYFITTIILTRPIGIIMTCYLGSGEIIPFEGWGLAVWAVIVIIMAILFFCSYKYQAQIEKFLTNLATKLQKRKKIKPVSDKNEENNTEEIKRLVEPTEENLPLLSYSKESGDQTPNDKSQNNKIKLDNEQSSDNNKT